MFLLDTNVISETAKPRPHPSVLRWSAVGVESTFVSAMTIGEIVKGIEALAPGKRRVNLHRWLTLLTSSAFKSPHIAR